MKTGATVAAFARPVRLRPVDRRSTPCPSPIAPRTSSLAVQTQRRKLRRTRPERSAWPEPEPTSSGPWQLREPMLPDDRDFGPAMARLTQRQRIFGDGLFCGLKQTAAARRAGYSNRGHADAVVSLKSRGCQRQLLHPPTHAHQSTPAKHFTTIMAVGFCGGSLARGTERQRITPDQRTDNCEPIIPLRTRFSLRGPLGIRQDPLLWPHSRLGRSP